MKIKTIIPLSILKKPLFIPIYLNIIPLIIGFYFFITKLKLKRIFIPILCIILVNIAVVIYQENYFSILKELQLILLLFFSSYLASQISHSSFISTAKIILFLSLLIFTLEYITLGPVLGYRDFFGIKLPRYVGPIGEFNFTGLLLSGISLIFLINRKYLFFIITLFVMLFPASRGAYLPVIVFLFVVFLHLLTQRNRKISKFILYSLFYTIVSYPFIVYFMHHSLGNIEIEKTLAIFSSMRYVYHVHYVDLGFHFPFGLGYFNGLEYLRNNITSIGGLFIFNYLPILEQHCMYIQIFSEFGFIGYIVFILFFRRILVIAYQQSFLLAAAWVSILTGFLFLNGLSEFILFFFIGYILNGRK